MVAVAKEYAKEIRMLTNVKENRTRDNNLTISGNGNSQQASRVNLSENRGIKHGHFLQKT